MTDVPDHIKESAAQTISPHMPDAGAKALAKEAEAAESYTAFASQKKSAEKLNEAAIEYARLQAEAAVADGKVKAAKREIKELLEKQVPQILSELGVPETVTPDERFRVGTKVQVRGGLAQAPDAEAAAKYLEELGFGGAMSTELSVNFTEEERDACAALAESLGESLDRPVTYQRSVHAGTLAAFAREKIAHGEPIDLEKLGLRAWREATIKEL